jgi:hypothetical protein
LLFHHCIIYQYFTCFSKTSQPVILYFISVLCFNMSKNLIWKWFTLINFSKITGVKFQEP